MKKTLNQFLKTWQRLINNAPAGQKKEVFKSFWDRFQRFNPEPMEGVKVGRVKGQYFKVDGETIVLKQFLSGNAAGQFSFYIVP